MRAWRRACGTGTRAVIATATVEENRRRLKRQQSGMVAMVHAMTMWGSKHIHYRIRIRVVSIAVCTREYGCLLIHYRLPANLASGGAAQTIHAHAVSININREALSGCCDLLAAADCNTSSHSIRSAFACIANDRLVFSRGRKRTQAHFRTMTMNRNQWLGQQILD